ncbi:hypothetical protein [Halovenus salina]|uniref:hypothetical protein n=1 Tax=Halovenus salina TaxID=1510225 RepID=UPI002260C3C2|nr:hypothetical protein [Halovenus salina]
MQPHERGDRSHAERRRAVPLRAAGYGFVAALGTYAGVVLFLGVHVVSTAHVTVPGVGLETLFLGTLGDFLSAHAGVTDGVVMGVAGVGVVPLVAYYLLPPVVLCWSARRVVESDVSRQKAAVQGAALVLGYAPAVVVVLATLAGSAEFAFVALDPTEAVLLAGIAYPLVFGGSGGVVVHLWSTEHT